MTIVQPTLPRKHDAVFSATKTHTCLVVHLCTSAVDCAAACLRPLCDMVFHAAYAWATHPTMLRGFPCSICMGNAPTMQGDFPCSISMGKAWFHAAQCAESAAWPDMHGPTNHQHNTCRAYVHWQCVQVTPGTQTPGTQIAWRHSPMPPSDKLVMACPLFKQSNTPSWQS